MTKSNQQPQDIFIILLAAILLFLCMQACKPVQVASSDTVVKYITKIEKHDSAVYLTDSAGFLSLLECDSLGMVRIKQIEQFYAGQFIQPKVIIKDNYLKVDCKIDSAKIAWGWNETHTVETKVINTVTVQRVNYVNGMQWFWIWWGRFLTIAGALVAIYFILKNTTWWVTLISWLTGLITKLFKK